MLDWVNNTRVMTYLGFKLTWFRVLIGVVVLAAIILAGCGEGNVLTEGNVIGKEYDDPDVWYGSTCVVYGKYGCQVSVPQRYEDGPHWKVQIEGTHTNDDGKSKTKREWYEVSQSRYDELRFGDRVEVQGDDLVRAG